MHFCCYHFKRFCWSRSSETVVASLASIPLSLSLSLQVPVSGFNAKMRRRLISCRVVLHTVHTYSAKVQYALNVQSLDKSICGKVVEEIQFTAKAQE